MKNKIYIITCCLFFDIISNKNENILFKCLENQSIRNLIEKGESYNRSMFSNKSSRNMTDDVTEQILFCQNGIDNLNVSSKNINSTFVSRNILFKKF
jgi:hypothetical protein